MPPLKKRMEQMMSKWSKVMEFMGWHKPDNGKRSFDGASNHATCKHCGREIMQDSTGAWFR